MFKIASLLGLLLCGCSAQDAMRFSRLSVYLPNVAQSCIMQRYDASVLASEYRAATELMFSGLDVEINYTSPGRRSVHVSLTCSDDPYGNALGRYEYASRSVDIYGYEVLDWMARYPDATEQDLAMMLANITAHEVGHAAGLGHDKRPGRVMSTGSGIRTFFEPWQW